MASCWHGTSLAGHTTPTIHRREERGRIYWPTPLGLLSFLGPGSLNFPSLSGCVTWSLLTANVGAVSSSEGQCLHNVWSGWKSEESLGLVRGNSGDRDAPTIASSLGSCQNLSLTLGEAGSAKYIKKWYHQGKGWPWLFRLCFPQQVHHSPWLWDQRDSAECCS